jgi:lysozyme
VIKKKLVAWAAICASCIAGAEGMRQTAYWDPYGKVWTVCGGETRGVKQGDRYTLEQCMAKLEQGVQEYGAGVDRCTIVPLPPKRKAAMTDFAWNVGVERYCRSIAPLLNAGQTERACDKLTEFVYAGGVKLPGLVKRRENERELCLS